MTKFFNLVIYLVKNNKVVTLTIIWLTLGLALIVIYLFLFGKVDWQVLTGFATWVLAGGIFLAFSQIREARRSTQAQIAVQLFQELRSKESKDTLSLIYKLRPDDIKRLYESPNIGIKNLKDEIHGLLDKYVMLGSLVNRGIVDKPLAIEAFGGAPALRCWYKLVEYIRKETCKRGYFLDSYEAFTRLCLEYFYDRHIEVNFYDEETNSKIPLVALFKLDSSLCPRSSKEIEQHRKKTP